MSVSTFHQKVVLVTGAGRGLGRLIVEDLAAQGATLALNDLTPINLDEIIASFDPTGSRIKAYIHDPSKMMPAAALATEVLEDWGRVDALINCASVVPGSPIMEMDEWDWLRTMEINLGSAFCTMQQLGRSMQRQGGGVIVNIVSIPAAFDGKDGPPVSQALSAPPPPPQAAFIASQAALLGLTLAAAPEFIAANIRLYALAVGNDNFDQYPFFSQLPLSFPRTGLATALAYLFNDHAGAMIGRVLNIPAVS